MMKCWKCGAELVPGALFCGACGAKQEQSAPDQEPNISGQEAAPPDQEQNIPGQEEIPPRSQPSFPAITAGAGGNNTILMVFAAICMAVCGWQALRALFGVLGAVFRIGWWGIFGVIRVAVLNGLTAVTLGLMAVVCALIAFKRNEQNSDGLLVCLAGSGVGVLVVKLLTMIVNMVLNPYSIGSLFGSFVWSALGVVMIVAGIYAIERFLLGETPIMGKNADDLKADVMVAFSSFQQAASEVGAQASKAAQNVKAEQQARAAAQQVQYQAGQQVQYQAGQQVQYQAGPQAQLPGQMPPPPSGYAPFRLKANRSLIAYIALTFLTCGLYSFYFIYALARDVNAACAGDGKSTAGLVKLLLLSMLTCGIYGIYWYYALGNRLAANAPRYGLVFQENGTTILLWQLIGALVCGIGPFVAWHIIIKNTNALCGAYNYQHGI